MVPEAEFWQTYGCMQNASEAGAETPISARPTPNASTVPSDPGRKGVSPAQVPSAAKPLEIGGPPGPEPTRYGDWEKKGRGIDF
jgi:hypothetical protein